MFNSIERMYKMIETAEWDISDRMCISRDQIYAAKLMLMMGISFHISGHDLDLSKHARASRKR